MCIKTKTKQHTKLKSHTDPATRRFTFPRYSSFAFLTVSSSSNQNINKNSIMSWSQRLGGGGGGSTNNKNYTSGNNKILQDDAPSLPTTTPTTTSNTTTTSSSKTGANNNNNNNQAPNLSKAWANNKLIPKPQSSNVDQQAGKTNTYAGAASATSTTATTASSALPQPRSQQPQQQAQAQTASGGSVPQSAVHHQIDYYVVLDFEATCQKDGRIRPQEIIEFPSVIVDANRAVIVAEFQRYVRPVHHPKLSDFCTGLTGIPQKVVDEASTFAVVWREYFKWLESVGLTQKEASSRVAWVTCGDWDLKTMLPSQLRNDRPSRDDEPEDAKCSLPRLPPAILQRWVNLKIAFFNLTNKRASGMPDMINELKVQMTGHHHSGIDDCRNIAKCLMALLRQGKSVDLTSGSFEPEEVASQQTRPKYPGLEPGAEKSVQLKDLAQLSKAAQDALEKAQAASKIQQVQTEEPRSSPTTTTTATTNNTATKNSNNNNNDKDPNPPGRRKRGLPDENNSNANAAAISSSPNTNENNKNNNQRQSQQQQQALPPSSSGLLPIVEVDKSRNAIRELLTAAGINVDQGPDAAQQAAFPEGPQQMTRVSKSLSSALRHNAIDWRIPMSLNGYVKVADLIRNNRFHKTTPTQLAALCFTNDKQRFGVFFGATKETSSTLYIRANQGHSIQDLELDLERITSPAQVPVAVHGTYMAAWNTIRSMGLSRMNRQHIHFALGLPGDNGVISGMRGSAEVLIYLDVEKVLKDGIALYKSENGVILTSGVDGILAPQYFKKIVDRRSGREMN